MSIPVIPEHKQNEGNCIGCPSLNGDECSLPVGSKCPDCAPDCPRCLAIKFTQWLVERHNGTTFEDPANIKDVYALVAIPIADWSALKKLADVEDRAKKVANCVAKGTAIIYGKKLEKVEG